MDNNFDIQTNNSWTGIAHCPRNGLKVIFMASRDRKSL
jgi:hypothetical protein